MPEYTEQPDNAPDNEVGGLLDPPDLHREMEGLRRRVEDLERREGRAVPTAATTTREPVGVAGASSTRTTTVMDALLGVSLPTYCAVAVTQAHQALVRRDVARQSGNGALADAIDEEIAGTICVTMNRVVDEYEFPDGVDLSEAQPGILRNNDEWQQEVQILQLAGLSQWLADNHLRAALQHVGEGSEGSSPQAVFDALRAVERGACSEHRRLVAARAARENDERQRARNRRRVRRLIFGLGGVTIVLSNGLATLITVPLLAPASIALGGAAAGAIANAVED